MERTAYEALLDIAIEREKEANTFYRDVADLMKDQTIKNIFMNLAKDEEAHYNFLTEYRNIPQMSLNFKEKEDFKITEDLDLPKLSIHMKPADAILLAIKKEQEAVDFYTELSNQSNDSIVKQACLELAKMETNHKIWLEDIYSDFAFIENF